MIPSSSLWVTTASLQPENKPAQGDLDPFATVHLQILLQQRSKGVIGFFSVRDWLTS
jgi:hypothetical protein